MGIDSWLVLLATLENLLTRSILMKCYYLVLQGLIRNHDNQEISGLPSLFPHLDQDIFNHPGEDFAK